MLVEEPNEITIFRHHNNIIGLPGGIKDLLIGGIPSPASG